MNFMTIGRRCNRRWIRVQSLLGLVVVLGVGCGDSGGTATVDAATGPQDASAADSSSADAAAGGDGGSALWGHPLEASPFGFHPGSQAGYSYLEQLGAVWSRDTIYVIWEWVDPDRDGHLSFRSATTPPTNGAPGGVMNYDQLRGQQPAWVRAVVDVCPYRNGGAFATEQQKQTYVSFVQKMVERYDGDEDLGCTEAAPDCYFPGDGEHPSEATIAAAAAAPVLYWQVCNQVTQTCEGPDCPQLYAGKYAEVHRLTYDAVKAANPSASVLIAGDSAQELYPAVFSALAGSEIDIVDFHYFGEQHEYDPEMQLAYLQAALVEAGFALSDIRFWVTETGTYSGDPIDDRDNTDGPPFQSERQQAAGLVKRYVAPLGAGVERVFWAWGLVEGFGPCDCCQFDYTGIVYDGNLPPNASGCDASDLHDRGAGVNKLAFFAAKQLFGKLSSATRVGEVAAAAGVRVYRFERDTTRFWVAWSDGAEPATVTISDIRTATARVTSSVPTADFGEEIVDESTAFSTDLRAVSAGSLEVELSTEPLFIEEL